MKLPLTEYGDETDQPALVLIPGLFGEGRNLAGLARRLAKTRRVFTLDMRNHGAANWSDTHDYLSMAGDIAETLQPLGPVNVMGHSMGGKAVMTLLLDSQAEALNVLKVIIADIAPVSYLHSHSDLINAVLSVNLDQVTKRADADDMLATQIEDRGLRGFLTHGLEFRDGEARWKHNFAALKKNMPEIIGFPYAQDDTRGLSRDVLFIAGDQSEYIDGNGRRAAQHFFPQAKFITLKNAGHWLHADAPEAFAATINGYLNLP